MLGAGLGDFQGKIGFRDHLFTYAVDLIAKNKAIVCRGLWTKFLKRQAFGRLLDDDDLITLSLQIFHDRLRIIPIFPAYGLCSPECGFLNLAVGWNTGDSGE